MAYKTAIATVLVLGVASYMIREKKLPMGVRNNNPLNVTKKSVPRGVRNNNPLNIRESIGDTTQWKGEALLDSDKSFEEFKSPAYGFRAAARILRSYNRQGFSTLSEIINRFAPSHENDTNNYVSQVSAWTGIAANQCVDVNNDDELAKVIHAMSRMEVGKYYGLAVARKGVAMA